MMDTLLYAWETGKLHLPDWRQAHTLDLIGALAARAGDPRPHDGAHVGALRERIGEADHLVFVLVDGLGVNLLSKLPADAFLRTHAAAELSSLFPSTTSAVITSLATGLWPAEHGVLGWFVYLAEQKRSVVALPFVDRMTDASLETLGLTTEMIWPFEALFARFGRDTRSVVPASFWDAPFNRFSRGGRGGAGFTSISSGVDQVIGRVLTARTPTFTYLYLPDLDSICHVNGTDGATTLATLTTIDAELARLADALRGRARVVISADHGHQNVARDDHHLLYDGDPLLDLLVVPPTAEKRAPVFHLRVGQHDRFRALFAERYGRRFALLTADEADELRLFGPMPLSSVARQRLGDFVAIAIDDVTLHYVRPADVNKPMHLSHHGGMSPAEMHVPLILA